MNKLPINLDNLIHAKSIENVRIDYKKGWDNKIKAAVVKTISAFANDLVNLNGGYIILGIEAPDGSPVLPPTGLDLKRLEKIQQEIRVACKKIEPEYQPLVVTEEYMGESIIVIWVPAGDNRPYRAPNDRNPHEKFYYVRLGAETVKAQGEVYRQLIEQTARIPFDDRRHLSASIIDISPILVKRFFREINSDLLNSVSALSDEELYKALRITTDFGGVWVPRNVSLLFFNENPHKYFSCSKFEVVQFGDDSGGNLIEENFFEGPIDRVVIEVLNYLNNLTSIQLKKRQNEARVERSVAYPYEALEEAIVNTVYHRSYENSSEPNKIYLYPDRIEIISYPGPVAGIKSEHLMVNQRIPPVPARNRRIGEFLKELRLAEMRGTGIPKIRRTMSQNGSPEPSFDFDSERTYFCVTLPAHPKYLIVHALRESSYLWSIGERKRATENLKQVFNRQPNLGAIAGQLIEYLYELGERWEAEYVFDSFHASSLKTEVEVPYLRYFKILFNNHEGNAARKIIQKLPEDQYPNDPVEVAIAFKRLKMFDKAHPLFAKAYLFNDSDPIYLHDFAKTKMEIANNLYWQKSQRKLIPDWETINRLRDDSIELLRKATMLFEEKRNRRELAACYFDLAEALSFYKNKKCKQYPAIYVINAYEKAIELLPSEQRFINSFNQWKDRANKPRTKYVQLKLNL